MNGALSELRVDPRIERAETPPGWFYAQPSVYERMRERVLTRAWHFAGSGVALATEEAEPFDLYPGALDEPLVLVRDTEDHLRCLSNVCTHRANLLVSERCTARGLRCRYHGRRFDLDGRFVSMPEFEAAEDFPRPSDDLRETPLGTWGPLAFTGLAPEPVSFDAWLGPLRERWGFFPFDALRFDAKGVRTFDVGAHWALYCENFLEGLHIPFVHPALNRALDYAGYRTETFAWGSLQVGTASAGEPCFELPADHPDAGQRIGAYYAWLFPTTMLNLYPWGLSLNAIEPLGLGRTRVRFLPFVARPDLRERGAGAGLDAVEQEDEDVVEAVQRGVRSRLYSRGRYSPTREVGVHHFHQLLLAFPPGARVSLGAAIKARLRHLLVVEKLERIESVAQHIDELSRERAELEQRIPLWDRALVFDDTPDEERAHTLDMALEPRRRVLSQLREEVEIDLARIGDEFPPFGLGVEIERCLRRARTRLRAAAPDWKAERQWLTETLEGLAERITSTWAQGFAPQAVFERLSDPSRCEQEASRAPDFEPARHPRLGVAPLEQEQLVALVGRRLLAGEFFPAKADLERDRAEVERLREGGISASGRVPLWERLNVFSTGRAQALEGERSARLHAAEERLQASYERTRGLLQKALAAYPPLAVHTRVAEALGVVSLLKLTRESAINEEGRVKQREVLHPRALVLAALRRLLEAFAEAFPDVPLPITVRQELSDMGQRPRSPRGALSRRFFQSFAESWSPTLREQALEHAALSANLARRADAVRHSMSVKDRVLFWSSVTRSRREDLTRRREWHAEAAARRWEELSQAARATAMSLAPLAARELALAAQAAFTEVRTDAGETREPRECRVYGRPAVVSSLVAASRALLEHYDLPAERAELFAAVAAVAPLGELPEAGPFEPIERAELVKRLALTLEPGSWAERYRACQARLDEASVWERVYLLTASSEHSEREAASQELSELAPELRADLVLVVEAFDQALDSHYPPARVALGLASVIRRVEALTATCTPRSVTVDGKEQSRYECSIEGHGLALAALRRWCATLVAVFGQLPSTHDLLEAYELRGISEQGWVD